MGGILPPFAEDHGSLSWDRRLRLARSTGEFFICCLEGANRRTACQSQASLANRVYLWVRENFRDSVVVGFASHTEA